MNVIEASGLGKRYGSTWARCVSARWLSLPGTWPRWSAPTEQARPHC
jgi:hypothetical protein